MPTRPSSQLAKPADKEELPPAAVAAGYNPAAAAEAAANKLEAQRQQAANQMEDGSAAPRASVSNENNILLDPDVLTDQVTQVYSGLGL